MITPRLRLWGVLIIELCCAVILVLAVLGFSQLENWRLRGQMANQARGNAESNADGNSSTVDNHGALECLIERSDLVVAGSVHKTRALNVGGTMYGTIFMSFDIKEVLKGSTPSTSVINVGIAFQGYLPLPPRTGQSFVLFLRRGPTNQAWQGTDQWFSMQSHNVALVEAIGKYVASHKAQSPNEPSEATR